MQSQSLRRGTESDHNVVVKVLGIDAAGADFVAGLIELGLTGVGFFVAESIASESTPAKGVSRVLLEEVAEDRGSGPTFGYAATAQTRKAITSALTGAHVVLIVGSMDGRMTNHATPLIAEIARSSGALTLAFVTLPGEVAAVYDHPGATQGIAALEEQVDALFLIDHAPRVGNARAGRKSALVGVRDGHVLKVSAFAIAKLLLTLALHDVEFEDARDLMKDTGMGSAACAGADGPGRSWVVAERLLASGSMPVDRLGRARGVMTIVLAPHGGDHPLQSREIREIVESIHAHCSEDTVRVFGTASAGAGGELQVVVLACGEIEPEAT